MSQAGAPDTARARSIGAIVFDLFLIAFVLLIVVAALDVSARAALFPLVVGVPTLMGLAIMLVRDFIGKQVMAEVAPRPPVYDPETGEHRLPDLSRADLGELVEAAQDEIQAEEVLPDTPEARRRQLLLAGWTVAVIALAAMTSFLVAVPIGLLVILLLTQRWYVALATTVGVTAFIYVLFAVILGIRF
jgi:hypothetical protein